MKSKDTLTLGEWLANIPYEIKSFKAAWLLVKLIETHKEPFLDFEMGLPIMEDRKYYELKWLLAKDSRSSLVISRNKHTNNPVLTFKHTQLEPLPYKKPVETEMHKEMLEKAIAKELSA